MMKTRDKKKSKRSAEAAAERQEELFILITEGLYGFFGKGPSFRIAYLNLCRAAKKKNVKSYMVSKFTSALQFAPSDRPANTNEADAWVGQDGSINWIRCNREMLDGLSSCPGAYAAGNGQC